MSDALKIDQREFWNQASKEKEFSDPFHFEEFSNFCTKESKILEYGCGYGRILSFLYENGFKNLKGVDSSSGMIARAKSIHPNLDCQVINPPHIPFADETFDVVIISTVLCCVPSLEQQIAIFSEIKRVLKEKGVLYFCDFLLTSSSKYQEKYKAGLEKFGNMGTYLTTEGAIVKHFSRDEVKSLTKELNEEWFLEEDFVTMNNNPVREFTGIYRK